MDAGEYKHLVLGLIFLKYISDAFEAKHQVLVTQKAQGAGHYVRSSASSKLPTRYRVDIGVQIGKHEGMCLVLARSG